MFVYFNPRSREGSDEQGYQVHMRQLEFQSTLPRRERPSDGGDHALGDEISIHAPAKGATARWHRRHLTIIYFNPRSREGSDRSSNAPRRVVEISIHAPAKGATLPEPIWQAASSHFNPRSREGSDNVQMYTNRVYKHFNPRSREGSDLSDMVTDFATEQFQFTLPRRERPPNV